MRIVSWIIRAIIIATLFWCLWEILEGIMKLSDFILSLTVGAIILYTLETFLMRKEMIKQTELSIIPLIAVDFDTEKHKLSIENVGYGVAKNVKIDKLEVEGDYEIKSVIFNFLIISAIRVGEKIELNNKLYTVAPAEGNTPVTKNLTIIGRHFTKQSHPFDITYEDIVGRKHSSKVQCGMEGCQILEFK